MSSKEGATTVEGVDDRMAWLMTRACSSMKVKPDKFKKMLAVDEYWQVVLQFLEVAHQRRLTIYIDAKEDLIPTVNAPAGLKRKGIVFLKKNEVGGLNVDGLNTEVEMLELSAAPLEQMSLVLEQVYLPLLSNKKNNEEWPEVLMQDMMGHINHLVADTHVTIGQTKGRTLLPLPPQDSSMAAFDAEDEVASRDKTVVHVLESVVVNWIRQVKAVLKTDSSDAVDFKSGPMVEIEFWAKKQSNLRNIDAQLHSDRVQKVQKILDISRSTYAPAFSKIATEVQEALAQTRDINKYLTVLRKQIEPMRQAAADDITKTWKFFEPVFHTVGLIFVNCQNYNTSARLVGLLREITNDIIDIATTYVDPNQILKIEMPEAVEKLETAADMCRTYKTVFLRYKTWFNQKYPVNAMKFDMVPVFGRFDSFEERLTDIAWVLRTCIEFARLEKVEIGGTKGTILSTQVQAIYQEFLRASAVFPNITYDVLDVSQPAFLTDLGKFRAIIRDLEERLGAIIVQGFEDCASVNMVFKLFESFDPLIYREIIKNLISKTYISLFQMFAQDLDQVYKIFQYGREHPPISDNMPAVSGIQMWCKSLLERINEPMKKVQQLSGAVFRDSDEARELSRKHLHIVREITEYQGGSYDAWTSGIDTQSESKLKEPLLVREPETNALVVNFDPVLVKLLREAKYFQGLSLEVPETMQRLYSNADKFYQFTTKLQMMASQYNKIKSTIKQVELNLVLQRVNDIDAQLEKGLKLLNWKSPGIKEFVDGVANAVNDLNTVLNSVHVAVELIDKIINNWSAVPLLERKDAKKLLNLEEERIKVQHKFREMNEGGREISKHLIKINDFFGVGKGHPNWKDYVQYINQKVVDGFARVVKTSLMYLINNMDPQAKGADQVPDDATRARLLLFTGSAVKKVEHMALMDLEMKLVGEDIVFEPGIDGEPGSLEEIMNTWMRLFFESSTQMHRLDNVDEDYFAEVAENEELLSLMDRMIVAMSRTTTQCRDYRESFLKYKYLWTDDRDRWMTQFLAEGGNARYLAAKAAQEAAEDAEPAAPADPEKVLAST